MVEANAAAGRNERGAAVVIGQGWKPQPPEKSGGQGFCLKVREHDGGQGFQP